MGTKKKLYLHNLARTMMGRLAISHETLSRGPSRKLSHILERHFGDSIRRIISGWNDETLGKIACYEVKLFERSIPTTVMMTRPNWRNGAGEIEGRTMVVEIATIKIIAAMAENIEDDKQSAEGSQVV